MTFSCCFRVLAGLPLLGRFRGAPVKSGVGRIAIGFNLETIA